MKDKKILKEYKVIPYFGLKVIEDQGIVEHLISVFGVEDLGGDIVHPGAFTKTITERAGMIRVLDSHNTRSALDVVGMPISLAEIGRAELPPKVLEKYPEATGGLKATTQFLMETPEGKGVFDRIKAGAVNEFSFAYDTLDSDPSDKEDGGTVRNLRTLRLWEYSPVVFGMNPATAVIDAKSHDEVVVPVFKNSKVQKAFEEVHNPEDSRDYWTKEVAEDFLVVEVRKTNEIFKVAYFVVEDRFEFTPRGEWVKGVYEFIETEEEEVTVDEEKHQKAMLLELDVELGLLEIAQLLIEAGPAAPPTS